MEKNISINIAIDGVNLEHLGMIQAALEQMLADYPDKRITMTIQDQPLVKFG